MKKLEDYWVISNVKGGRRKYNSKAEAIASLDGKIPTYDHKKFKLEHHMVTVEDVEPTVEVPNMTNEINKVYSEAKTEMEKVQDDMFCLNELSNSLQ